MLHFSHTNIHVAAGNSCVRACVNGKMAPLALSRTTSLENVMTRTPRTQPTLAMGFAAQGIGSSCDASMTIFELLAPAKNGVAATQWPHPTGRHSAR
jgi:hypothetical protein